MLRDEKTFIYENEIKGLKIDFVNKGFEIVEDDSTITIYDGDKKIGIFLMIEEFERV